MMACYRTCLGVESVVVADYEPVDGEGVLLGGDLLGETGNAGLNGTDGGIADQLSLYGMETLTVEPVHALTPGVDGLFRIYQGERNPLDVAVTDVLRVFHR